MLLTLGGWGIWALIIFRLDPHWNLQGQERQRPRQLVGVSARQLVTRPARGGPWSRERTMGVEGERIGSQRRAVLQGIVATSVLVAAGGWALTLYVNQSRRCSDAVSGGRSPADVATTASSVKVQVRGDYSAALNDEDGQPGAFALTVATTDLTGRRLQRQAIVLRRHGRSESA